MAESVACGSMSLKVIDVNLDGHSNCCMWVHVAQGGGVEELDDLECCMWVHVPEGDRCKARWAEQHVACGSTCPRVVVLVN